MGILVRMSRPFRLVLHVTQEKLPVDTGLGGHRNYQSISVSTPSACPFEPMVGSSFAFDFLGTSAAWRSARMCGVRSK